MFAFLLAQIDTSGAGAASSVANTPQAQGMSFLELMVKGGIVMIPIALLSLISLYIIIERYLSIKKATKYDPGFIMGINQNLITGNITSARAMCHTAGDHALPRVIETGISNIGQPLREIEDSLETVSNMEIKEMERNMEYLGLIAGIAPMLGFIGTISGIIKIFYQISITENVSISIIAGGLYEKMLTSGAGLLVGIIAYSGYHLLNMRIDRFALRLERNVYEFVKTIKSPSVK
jgi:biopolymer transport protein ExbB